MTRARRHLLLLVILLAAAGPAPAGPSVVDTESGGFAQIFRAGDATDGGGCTYDEASDAVDCTAAAPVDWTAEQAEDIHIGNLPDLGALYVPRGTLANGQWCTWDATAGGLDCTADEPAGGVTLDTTAHDYLGASGQTLTLGPIDLSADVTGALPWSAIGNTPTTLDGYGITDAVGSVTAGLNIQVTGTATAPVISAVCPGTDLSVSYSPTQVEVDSSTGAAVALAPASAGVSAGILSAAQAQRLADCALADDAPTAHADSHAAGGSDPIAISLSQVSDAGTAASRDVGSTAGTVAAGDDARLSDARTPTAHAASHAEGAADEISPSDIGAATAAQGDLADTAVQPAALGVAGVMPVIDLGDASDVAVVLDGSAYTARLTGYGDLLVSAPPGAALRYATLYLTDDGGGWELSAPGAALWLDGTWAALAPGVGEILEVAIRRLPDGTLLLSARAYY